MDLDECQEKLKEKDVKIKELERKLKRQKELFDTRVRYSSDGAYLTSIELQEANKRLKETNRKLKDAQTQLIQSAKMSSLGTLAGGLAHEINNNNSIILTNIQLLLKDAEGKEKERLEKMQRACRESKNIIQNLLYFTKTTREERTGKADLEEALDRAAALLSKKLEDIELEKDYSDVSHVQVNMREIQQVFVNLILNAIEAIHETRKLKKTGRIKLSSYEDEDSVVISIQDNGVGMSEETVDKIFDPFFTTKDVGEGTGLGLSVALRIVEKYDGDIEVTTEQGEGSEFKIIFRK